MAAAASLEHEVEYWTDFFKASLAPKSVYELPGLWRDVAVFDAYGDGGGIMTSEAAREDITDRVRGFVEECDYLQVSVVRWPGGAACRLGRGLG